MLTCRRVRQKKIKNKKKLVKFLPHHGFWPWSSGPRGTYIRKYCMLGAVRLLVRLLRTDCDSAVTLCELPSVPSGAIIPHGFPVQFCLSRP